MGLIIVEFCDPRKTGRKNTPARETSSRFIHI